MGDLARSARLFGGGIGHRLWSLIPGALLGAASVYEAFIKPFLSSEWQRLSLAVPLPLVLAFLALGLVWAALLTYHDLRMHTLIELPPTFSVASGATFVYAPAAQSVTLAAPGRGARLRMSDGVPLGQQPLWGPNGESD